MAGKRDYYDVLGVSRSASEDEIRSAHRKLARKLHPDINKEADAAERFSEVQEAYDVLSDSEKRQKYDQFGHAGLGGGGASGGGGPTPSGGWSNVDPDSFEDIFGEVFGGRRRGGTAGFGDFGDTFGVGAGARTRPVKGRDVEHELDVGFAVAAFGGTERLRMSDASGEAQSIDVKIPAGTASGSKLRVRDKGMPGSNGGPAGDLILKIKVGAHPWFKRDGLDLSVTVPISITEAALGASVQVPLLKGSAALKIPPGMRSGGRLRLKGKGIDNTQGKTGDLHAVIEIVAPSELQEGDQEALTEIGSRLPNPRADVPWAADVAE
ncbi:MAG: DnaJ domain-containing protein [Phycisphaerales bacterium]|nr:DnaJ domain-containing protein [Phycisphaerales bacterium]